MQFHRGGFVERAGHTKGTILWGGPYHGRTTTGIVGQKIEVPILTLTEGFVIKTYVRTDIELDGRIVYIFEKEYPNE